MLFPHLAATAAPMPALPLPDDDGEVVRWLVTDGWPAQPWLPTLAEQDARWWETYGENVERMKAGRRMAEHVAGRA